MKATQRTLNPTIAVLAGTLVVNVPVLALLFVPAYLASGSIANTLVLLVMLASFVAAWAWWSFSVPRWRLWAYERVPSTGALHNQAVAAGLLWPRGSFLEKTEIKSAAHRRREREFERLFP